MTPPPAVDILGLPVRAFDIPGFMACLDKLVGSPNPETMVGINAHTLSLTHRIPEYHEALCTFDYLYAEGASIVLASYVLGTPLPAKLTTTDLWPLVCRLARDMSYRVYLLGGEEGLADEAARKAMAEWPGLRVVGTHHGYFALDDEGVVKKVNKARPDLLWVGMGEPKQVFWSRMHSGKLHVGVIITCGGMFRIIAGRQLRPGPAWHKFGMEWLGRIIQEPSVWRRYAQDLPLMGKRILVEILLKRKNRTIGP